MKKFFIGILLILSACNSKYVSLAKTSVPKTVSIEVPTVVEQMTFTFNGENLELNKTTVTVTIQGAGVFISPKGHILTCAHLFNVGLSTSVAIEMSDGRRFPAILVYQDKDKDLALVKVDTVIKNYMELSNTSLAVGQDVIAIGNPQGLGFSVTRGIISHLDRNLSEPYMFTQVDTPINPGNSGGPLLDMGGKLIGINARRIPNSDGLGFAVTPSTIRQFLSVFEGL